MDSDSAGPLGSSSSRRQSAQVAASAGMPVLTWPLRIARDDTELFFSFWRNSLRSHRIDARKRRSFRFEAAEKCFHFPGRPFDLDGHASRIVADEAREALLCGEPVDEWPKPDALHDTAHDDRFAPHQPFGFSWFWTRPLAQFRPRSGISIAQAVQPRFQCAVREPSLSCFNRRYPPRSKPHNQKRGPR